MDHYTPSLPRPTEAYAWHRKNTDCHEAVLRHFSSSLSLQESKVTQLMHNFDIHIDDDSGCDRVGNAELDASCFSSSLSNMTSSPSPKFLLSHQQANKHSEQPSAIASRPGRLSPATIEMVLASNTSTVSELSSAADTSYDSGLYQWLGVRMDAYAPESSPGVPNYCNKHFDVNVNNTSIDRSMMSLYSAYSQPSPASQTVYPLSPPPTACPPFLDILCDEQTSASPQRSSGPPLPPKISASMESTQVDDNSSDIAVLHDLAKPMLSNNVSLRHCLPSASVMRHFQQAIDELKGLYNPNDTGNNTPSTMRPQIITTPAYRSFLGSRVVSPSRISYPLSCNQTEYVHRALKHNVQPVLPMDDYTARHSKATRELYTEMAVMLFAQVANEESLATNLRNLLNRLEALTGRKRKVALVIGMLGRGRC